MAVFHLLTTFVAFTALAQSVQLNTDLTYTISNAALDPGFFLYCQTTGEGDSPVVLSDSNATDGKYWYFDIVSDDVYVITNKLFPGYRLDGSGTKVPFLSPVSNVLQGQSWHIDTWSDGSYKFWQDCCTVTYTLAVLSDGVSTNVTKGNDDTHRWFLQSLTASSTTSIISTATPSTTRSEIISAPTSASTAPTVQSSASPASSSSATPTPSPSQSGSASQGGLSASAKGGIGAGVSVGAILVLAGLFVLWKRRQRTVSGISEGASHVGQMNPYMAQNTPPNPWKDGRTELESTQHIPPAEMSSYRD